MEINNNNVDNVDDVIETSKRLQEDIEKIRVARSQARWDVEYAGKAFNKVDPQAISYLCSLGLKKWTRRAKKCWNLQKYCTEHIMYIRGFDQAYKDGFKDWECHHVMETMYPMHLMAKLLQELNIYEHIPARYLVFLKKDVHLELHKVNKRETKRYDKWMYDAYLAGLN